MPRPTTTRELPYAATAANSRTLSRSAVYAAYPTVLDVRSGRARRTRRDIQARDALGLRDEVGAAEQQTVDGAEGCERRSNADRDRQRDHGAEASIQSRDACRMANVAP
jgi:hypothetical protein